MRSDDMVLHSQDSVRARWGQALKLSVGAWPQSKVLTNLR